MNACQCNIQVGELRVSTISSSTEGLPNAPFMDHYCPCFIRRFGKTKEDIYTMESKIASTTKSPTTETTGSKLSTLSIAGRTNKLRKYLYILQISHTHNDPTAEERTIFQWHVTFKQMCQEKLLPFLGDVLRWLTKTAMTRDVRDIKKRVNQLIKHRPNNRKHWYMLSWY